MSAIGMPGHLLALFAARPPLERLPAPRRKRRGAYNGLSDFISLFENSPPPAVEAFEAPSERKERLKREKAAEVARELKVKVAEYDPMRDPDKVKTQDPRKTLFVGRLSYETTEKKLLKTFEAYGPVRDIRLVCDHEGKPRGYAFVEYKAMDALRTAYREAAEKVLDGRKIVVDYERARTTKKWLPRRLGGGEGPPRKGVSKRDLAARAAERRLHSATAGGGGAGGMSSHSHVHAHHHHHGGGGMMAGGMRHPPSGGAPMRRGGGPLSRGGPPPWSSSSSSANERRLDYGGRAPAMGGSSRYGSSSTGGRMSSSSSGAVGGGGGLASSSSSYNRRSYGAPPPQQQAADVNATGANNIPVGKRY